jgi:hypothetical protein
MCFWVLWRYFGRFGQHLSVAFWGRPYHVTLRVAPRVLPLVIVRERFAGGAIGVRNKAHAACAQPGVRVFVRVVIAVSSRETLARGGGVVGLQVISQVTLVVAAGVPLRVHALRAAARERLVSRRSGASLI